MIISTEVHQRTHRVKLDRFELSELVSSAICRRLSIEPTDPSVTIEVSFEDVNEGGSLPYRVGTKATVEIVEDLMPQEASPSPPGGQMFAR